MTKEERKLYMQEYRKTEKWKLSKKESDKKYYQQNKEVILENNKNYYIDNKKEINNRNREYSKRYYQQNYNKIKYYNLGRYISNTQTKLSLLLRVRLNNSLKGKTTKSISVATLLGCSVDKCKQYLESQFKPEMTWDNHGKIWEIDHIIPCSKFNLTDIEQQKQCFHYTNLQPLFKTTEIAESLGYNNEIGNRNKSNITNEYI